jgi:hypothetical protein
VCEKEMRKSGESDSFGRLLDANDDPGQKFDKKARKWAKFW